MELTKYDRDLIEELTYKYNNGERINSNLLTNLYNRITGKKVSNVNCATCLRKRLFELIDLLAKTKRTYKDRLSKDDEEFLFWAKGLEEGHYPDFGKVVLLYNRVFNQSKVETNCLGCIKLMLADLYELL